MAAPKSFRIGAAPAIAVHEWGGDGPPVLLAHATGFHGMVWAPVAERLARAGRHVVSFDFRGHGDSDPSPTGYRWSGFADDALGVVDHLDLATDTTLLAAGHSKGAAAILLAELDRPGTFPRIWCFEPIVPPMERALPVQPDNPMSVTARKRRAVWPSRADALASYGSRPPLGVLHPDALAAYVDHGLRDRPDGRVELKCRPDDEADMYSMGSSHDGFARLGQIIAPTLVAFGATTDPYQREMSTRVAARLPGGRLEEWSGRGHFGPLENPDAAVGSILRFESAT